METRGCILLKRPQLCFQNRIQYQPILFIEPEFTIKIRRRYNGVCDVIDIDSNIHRPFCNQRNRFQYNTNFNFDLVNEYHLFRQFNPAFDWHVGRKSIQTFLTLRQSNRTLGIILSE